MHKKLLALITTFALALSMFTGIAYASRASIQPLTLSTTKVISSAPNTDYQQISGTIPAGAYATDNFSVKVEGNQAGVIYEKIDAPKGQFYFYLPTNLAAQDITIAASHGSTVVAIGTVAVRYNVSITPKQLKFDYTGQQDPVVITGQVTNSKGEPVVGESVLLVGVDADGTASGSSYFTGVTTNNKGEFGSAVLQWQAAEQLELRIGSDAANAVTHVQGEVAPQAATIEITPQKAVHTIAKTRFEVAGTGFAAAEKDVSFTLLKDSQQLSDHGNLPLPQGVQTDSAGSFTTAFTWVPPQAGTYTLIATTDNYRASATIVVTNPSNYNLINGPQLEELKVGANEFNIGPSDIHLVHYIHGDNFSNEFVYTLYIDGQIAQDTGSGQDFAKLETGKITIPATGLGTRVIKIVAHKLSDRYNPDAKPAFERTITAKVSGWEATISPAQLTVNQTQDITLILKNEKGEAVNNVRVDIEGYATYLPGTANVQDGSYRFKDVKLMTVGPKAIRAYQGARLMAELELEVVGQQVYKVQPDVTTLLQGKGEAVQLAVTRGGKEVTPWLVRWIYADGTSDSVYPTHLAAGVSTVNINAAKVGPLTIHVANIDGTLCGETTIEVVAPKLVLIDQEAANLTNNFKTQVRFKIVDPRNNSVLTENLSVVPNHFFAIELYDAKGTVAGTTVVGAAAHSLTILPKATAADWNNAHTNNESITVGFKIGDVLVDGVLPVKEAVLTSNPNRILIGAKNNLTLTYLDANGMPIVGKEVIADEARLGKTDSKGQAIYPISVVTSAAVAVKADTDVASVKVGLTIELAFDNEAPQLTYKVVENKADFIITDDIRITRINIDGKEIDFWPGPTYQFSKTLQSGINRVHIKAQDSNDNVLDQVISIEYKPEPEAVVLRGSQVQRHDDVIFVQARQLQELGAKFTWNATARTATFTLGNSRVGVTIGSLTGTANGQLVAMPAAPFLDNGRTYIPLRFVSETLGWKVHWAPGDIITILPKP